jgi:hypothetical protein
MCSGGDLHDSSALQVYSWNSGACRRFRNRFVYHPGERGESGNYIFLTYQQVVLAPIVAGMLANKYEHALDLLPPDTLI